jgi:HEAT repeat protein
MLSAPQVLPFLTHADSEVRYHAAQYFIQLGDRSPTETADQLWSAIDRFGQLPSRYGEKQIQHFLRALRSVPQNDISVGRAIDLLRSSQSDPENVWRLCDLLASLPLELLDRRREEIFALANANTRRILEHRLRLHEMPVEEVWQMFLDHGIAAEKAEDSSKVDSEQADRLVAALAAHPEFSIPHAMAILEDPQDRYWLGLWCVDLLGQLRHTPAVDLMIAAMRDDEGDFLKQSAVVALSRLDSNQVVPKLEASFANDDIYYRMRVADTLGKSLCPLAEACLVRLLPHETDHEVTSALCGALYDLCATEGLEEWRQVILQDRFDSSYNDVRESLVTLAKMVDYNPPEMEQWRAEVQTASYGLARRERFLGKLGMTVEQADTMKRLIEQLAEQREEPARSYESPAALVPIRRDTPKIGRNDPCPCGSGKKYKKCCG